MLGSNSPARTSLPRRMRSSYVLRNIAATHAMTNMAIAMTTLRIATFSGDVSVFGIQNDSVAPGYTVPRPRRSTYMPYTAKSSTCSSNSST